MILSEIQAAVLLVEVLKALQLPQDSMIAILIAPPKAILDPSSPPYSAYSSMPIPVIQEVIDYVSQKEFESDASAYELLKKIKGDSRG